MIEVTKFGEDKVNSFWVIEERPGDGPIPPDPNRIKEASKLMAFRLAWFV